MTCFDEKIKRLGFGIMRGPMLGGEVNIELLKQLVDLFMSRGFSYFDTAPAYLAGKAESIVKQVLVDRYPRDSFQLASKLPAWHAETEQEAKAMFNASLSRAGVDYFDYFLLHNVGGPRLVKYDKFGTWDFLAEKKAAGYIKHLGLSMHAKAEEVDKVLATHPEMEFIQLQINYADWDSPVLEARACYEAAKKHGKPITVMEPVKGGALAHLLPKQVAEIFTRADPQASVASWAIRYAASLEGVAVVLSGMVTVEQVLDNMALIDDFRPLSDDERQVIEHAKQALAEIPQYPCTDCRYCMEGCPKNIGIPLMLRAFNDYLLYRNLNRFKLSYDGVYETESVYTAKASTCIGCGQCEKACPQNLPIIEGLAKVTKLYETDEL